MFWYHWCLGCEKGSVGIAVSIISTEGIHLDGEDGEAAKVSTVEVQVQEPSLAAMRFSLYRTSGE